MFGYGAELMQHRDHCYTMQSSMSIITGAPGCLAQSAWRPQLPCSTAGLATARRNCRLSRKHLTIVALDGRDDGGFGARDARQDELDSEFGDKVVSNWDTDHIIMPPAGMAKVMGLRSKTCSPLEEGAVAFDDVAVENNRRQVPGWRRVVAASGGAAIRHDWKVKDNEAGQELMRRIGMLADLEGHFPRLTVEEPDNVSAELSTIAVGGLTQNDFILASKINDMDFADLMPKKKMRFWA